MRRFASRSIASQNSAIVSLTISAAGLTDSISTALSPAPTEDLDAGEFVGDFGESGEGGDGGRGWLFQIAEKSCRYPS